MTEFLGRIYSWLAFIPKITLGNLFEILIISFLIYEILIWVQNTRAWVLLKGGLIRSTWRESPVGPPRKYYELTAEGREAYDAMHRAWLNVRDALDTLLKENR